MEIDEDEDDADQDTLTEKQMAASEALLDKLVAEGNEVVSTASRPPSK